LDSNQQPSGYPQSEISDARWVEGSAALRQWDAMFDFYAAGWIAEEKAARARWLIWLCPAPGLAWAGAGSALTWRHWSEWIEAIDRWEVAA
jgi:hypothetical protein